MKVQRLRIAFSRGEQAGQMSLLELLRAWEQAFREGGLPLAYSEGRRLTAQISTAAPLPVGVTSACELMDVFLAERVDPRSLIDRVSSHLSAGLAVQSAWEVGLALPSLQSQVRWAEYEVVLATGRPRKDVQANIDELLAASTLPWRHERESKVRSYDLRPRVLDIWIEGEEDGALTLGMRLRAEQEMAGRADQVTAALGFTQPLLRVHRRRLYVEATPPVAQAYRRLGEPDRD